MATTVPTARKHAELSEDEQALLTYLDMLERQGLYSDPWIREAMQTGFPYYFKFTVYHEGGSDIKADGILDDVLEAAKEFGIGPHHPGEDTDAKWQWTTRSGKPHWLDVILSSPKQLDFLSPYVSDFIDVKLREAKHRTSSNPDVVKRMMNPRNY